MTDEFEIPHSPRQSSKHHRSFSEQEMVSSTMSSYMPSATPGTTLGSVLTSENAAEAGTFAKATAMDLHKNISEGDWSLRLLALLGGLAMIVASALGFVGNVLLLHWISALFEVYTFCLGIIIVILESGRRLSFFSKLENNLYKNALFLKYVWGRGIIYFVAGSLQVSQRDLVDLIVGFFVCFVGIMYILVGRQAAKKLGQIRRSTCTPEQLQESFAKADVDGKGSLTIEQFRGLTNELGLDLNQREAEAAFIQLDYSHTGRLTFESVQMWWTDDATEQDLFAPAVFM